MIAKINGDVVKIVKSPELIERLKADGSDPVGSTTAEYAAFLRDEIAKWRKVIAAANIKGLQ